MCHLDIYDGVADEVDRYAVARESDLIWYFPDVMATLAELAGVSNEVPEDTDGISVVPTLLGKGDQKKHDYLLWRKAIRMGKWKGVGNPGELALYDLSTDIGEENNLAEKHPVIVNRKRKSTLW